MEVYYDLHFELGIRIYILCKLQYFYSQVERFEECNQTLKNKMFYQKGCSLKKKKQFTSKNKMQPSKERFDSSNEPHDYDIFFKQDLILGSPTKSFFIFLWKAQVCWFNLCMFYVALDLSII